MRKENRSWKVFVIHGCDWIVANDEASAIDEWEYTTGENFDLDEYEISEEKRELSTLHFTDDTYDKTKVPFDKKIIELIESGKETVPFFFASSEY